MTTTLNRWHPVRQLEDFRRDLLRTFRPVGVFYPISGGDSDPQAPVSWSPSMDVIENDKGYLISAELPGMRKEDISVMLENDVVTVRGERKAAYGTGDERETWHVSERNFGAFERAIPLPKDVDPCSLQAELKEGILFLHFGKKEEARPRLIDVN